MQKSNLRNYKHFKRMTTRTHLQIYKTSAQTPAILLCISSKTNVRRRQPFKNRALRSASGSEDQIELSLSELRDKDKNRGNKHTTLHTFEKKVWVKMAITNKARILTEEATAGDPDYEAVKKKKKKTRNTSSLYH